MPDFKSKLRGFIKLALWVCLVQFILANISAAIYAYKFTHFYKEPGEWNVAEQQNVFSKTWKLFTGPSFGKKLKEKQPDFPYEPVTLKTRQGILLSGWYSELKDARGTVCLFHGLLSNKSYYLREAAAFRKKGFNVMLVDFSGHGKSQGMRTTIGYHEAGDVKLVYDFCQAKTRKPIYLYGGSMGAVSIARAIAVHDLKPAGVILDMPFDRLQDHIRARGRSFGFPQKLFAYPVTAWIGIENGFPSFSHNTSTYARNIHCPVLLQWGDHDFLVTPEETNEIFRSLGSKNKKLVIYKNAIHSSLMSQDPYLWEKEMDGFIERTITSGS